MYLKAKYDIVPAVYDVLDYPWERMYRRWRPVLLGDIRGRFLRLGFIGKKSIITIRE